tara:strand:- start:1988 stop:2200 length:213 start_codon:yes stop_codon:yes gene_type:complete
MTHKPTSLAEKSAAAKAHAHILSEGFTPSDVHTFVTVVPGQGATVFSSSVETLSGTFGHPASHVTVIVTA